MPIITAMSVASNRGRTKSQVRLKSVYVPTGMPSTVMTMMSSSPVPVPFLESMVNVMERIPVQREDSNLKTIFTRIGEKERQTDREKGGGGGHECFTRDVLLKLH